MHEHSPIVWEIKQAKSFALQHLSIIYASYLQCGFWFHEDLKAILMNILFAVIFEFLEHFLDSTTR